PAAELPILLENQSRESHDEAASIPSQFAEPAIQLAHFRYEQSRAPAEIARTAPQSDRLEEPYGHHLRVRSHPRLFRAPCLCRSDSTRGSMARPYESCSGCHISAPRQPFAFQ